MHSIAGNFNRLLGKLCNERKVIDEEYESEENEAYRKRQIGAKNKKKNKRKEVSKVSNRSHQRSKRSNILILDESLLHNISFYPTVPHWKVLARAVRRLCLASRRMRYLLRGQNIPQIPSCEACKHILLGYWDWDCAVRSG